MKFRLPESAYDPEPPPILGTWRNVYIFVLCYLATVITVFYIFTRIMA